MDRSPPGSSVHGILQARILEWVAMPSSRGSSWPRVRTCASCIGRQVLYHERHLGSPYKRSRRDNIQASKEDLLFRGWYMFRGLECLLYGQVKLPSTNQLPLTIDNHHCFCWLLKFLAMCSWRLRLLDIAVPEKIPEREMLNMTHGASLVVQWLRLCTPNAGGPGPIAGQETGPYVLQIRACMPEWRPECHN